MFAAVFRFFFRFVRLSATSRLSLVAHIHTITHAIGGPLCCALFARQHYYTNSYIIFDFRIISLIYIEIESTKLRSAHICRSIFHFILSPPTPTSSLPPPPPHHIAFVFCHELGENAWMHHSSVFAARQLHRPFRRWLTQKVKQLCLPCVANVIYQVHDLFCELLSSSIIHVAREMADIYLCSIINIFIVTIIINRAYLAARCHSTRSTHWMSAMHTLRSPPSTIWETTNTKTKSKKKRKNGKQKAVIAISDILHVKLCEFCHHRRELMRFICDNDKSFEQWQRRRISFCYRCDAVVIRLLWHTIISFFFFFFFMSDVFIRMIHVEWWLGGALGRTISIRIHVYDGKKSNEEAVELKRIALDALQSKRHPLRPTSVAMKCFAPAHKARLLKLVRQKMNAFRSLYSF